MKYISSIVVAALLALTSVGSVEAGKDGLANTQTIKKLKARGVEAVYAYDVDVGEGRVKLMPEAPVLIGTFMERVRGTAPDITEWPVDSIEVIIGEGNLDEHINLFIDNHIHVRHVRETGALLLAMKGVSMSEAVARIAQIDPVCFCKGVYLEEMNPGVIRYGERSLVVE